MKIPLHLTILPLVLLPSCASLKDGASGINEAEMHALEENYYWKETYKTPSFAPGELEQLMDSSADPSLDGERAEGQSSAVAVALASVGDERFSAALATRTPEVRAAVANDVRYLWTHYKLRHPKTQAIAAGTEREPVATAVTGP